MPNFSFLSLMVKWGPKIALILLCVGCFYGGFTYKEYLVAKQELQASTEAFNHYADNYKDHIDNTHTYELEYNSRIKELDDDTSIDCNSVAPQCLRNAF